MFSDSSSIRIISEKRVLFADKKAQIEPTFFCSFYARFPRALDHSTRWDSALSLNLPHTSNPLIKGSPIGLRPEVYLEHLGHPGKNFRIVMIGMFKEDTLEDMEPDTLQTMAHSPASQGPGLIQVRMVD